jgi:hypothetical protein
MHDPVLVQVLDGAGDGADEPGGVPDPRRVAANRRGQTTAADEFHCDVGLSVALPGVEDLDDVRMG